MLSVIQSCKTDGADILYKSVECRKPTFDDEYKFLMTDSLDNLFIRCPDFRYQKEFRIFLCKEVPLDLSIIKDCDRIIVERKYDAVDYFGKRLPLCGNTLESLALCLHKNTTVAIYLLRTVAIIPYCIY